MRTRLRRLAAVAAALLPARWFSDGRARERSTP